MKATVAIEINIETTTCAACGVVFGLPDYLMAKRREDGQSFYCPNGHSLSFGPSAAQRAEAEAKKAKQEAARLQGQLDQARAALADEEAAHLRASRRAAATQGQLTKLKKRVAAGVCPCCHRSFQNLGRHMTGQHPTYAAEELARDGE